MATSNNAVLDHDCAFLSSNLQELLAEGKQILNAAIEISNGMEASMQSIASIYASIDGRDKESSLGDSLNRLQGTLVKEQYSQTLSRMEQLIDKLLTDMPMYDSQLAGQMDELGAVMSAIRKRITDIKGVLTSVDIGLGYDAFSAKLDEIKGAWDSTTEELAARLAEIEEEMLGVSVDAVCYSKDPVNLSTGNFVYDHEDLHIRGEIPLSFHRYYNSKDHSRGSMGRCFLHNYEISLEEKDDGVLRIRMWDGQKKTFHKRADGSYQSRNAALEELTGNEEGYILRQKMGDTLHFDITGKLVRQEDSNGRGVTFTYDGENRLQEARNDHGMTLHYTYDEKGYLVVVKDDLGREVQLTYASHKISTVTLPSGAVYGYRYGKNGRITEIVNPRENVTVKNTYDDKYRILYQEFPDGGSMSYDYEDESGRVILTERNGSKIIYVHDDRYRNIATIYEDGTSERYTYNEKNLRTSVTDRNGNTRQMAYDNRGNLTQTVDATGQKVNFTYDSNNRLLKVSVNGRERLKNQYDAKGNLIATENAKENGIRLSYDGTGRPVKLHMADGSVVELTYDDRGNISSIMDGTGAKTTYAYDEANRVTETWDANGNRTGYVYDRADRVIEVANAVGDSRRYVYNESGKVTEIIDFDGYRMQAAYNCLNRIECVTDKEGNETHFTYDKMWNLATQTLPNGAVNTFYYNGDNRLERVHTPVEGTIAYTYDAVGNRIGITDAEGNHTAFSYDAANRLTEVVEANGAKTCYGYDAEGNLITVTDALGQVTAYTYDELGRRISMTDALGNTTSVCYDSMGNMERVCYPNGSSMTYSYAGGRLVGILRPDGATETYCYDGNGNLIRRENGLGEAVTMEYDCLNRLTTVTNPAGGVRRYVYDAVGHVIELIDENGNQTKYTYSPNGNLTKVIDALGNETNYEYNCMGNLIKVERVGETGEDSQVTTFEWNEAGKLSTVTDPLGYQEVYSYNAKGKLQGKIDRDGYHTSYTYDAVGNLTNILFENDREVIYSYDALRQLREMTDWLGKTVIELDALGRPISVTDSEGKTIQYKWNYFNQRTEMVYPNGTGVHYEYDSAGKLRTLTEGENTTSYHYNENGNLIEKVLPNGIHTSYQYNERGRIESLTHTGAEISEGYQFAYDANGNKICATYQINGIIDASKSYEYRYNGLNQLVGVMWGEHELRTYAYDAFGNRVEKKDFIGEQVSQTIYQYNAKNQLIQKNNNQAMESLLTYRYDGRGNLTGVMQGNELQKRFEFDETNQLSAAFELKDNVAKAARYTYDGMGHRVGQEIFVQRIEGSLEPLSQIDFAKMQPENQFHYVLDITKEYNNLLERVEALKGKKQQFIWDTNVISMQETGMDRFYLQDAQGSVINLTDKNGSSLERYEFDEFGLPEQGGFTSEQPFAFAGYQLDIVGEIYYAQARRYDASVGRFISEDKIRGNIVAPFTLNHYGYCWNRPLDFVDLDGRMPQWLERILRGIKAHTLLESQFYEKYGSQGGEIEFPITSGISWTPTGTGRADIVYFNSSTRTVEVYEIKPESNAPDGALHAMGLAQLEGYINALNDNGQIVNGWEAKKGASLNTYFDTITIEVTEGLFAGESIEYNVYEDGMIIYEYEDQGSQGLQETVQIPAEVREKCSDISKRVAWAGAGAVLFSISAGLYMDTLMTCGIGIIDDGLATVLVLLAIYCFEMAFSPDISNGSCPYLEGE